MNKILVAFALLVTVYVASCDANVNSGSYRHRRLRLTPGAVQRGRFTLTRPRGPARLPLRFAGVGRPGFPRRRIPVRRPFPGKGPVRHNKLGPTSALRAGQEGSYDFADQHNAIIPDKKAGKPTKETKPKVSKANKINIESKIAPKKEEDNEVVEKVHIGNTAIIHCTFDDMKQIGAYKQAKIWWTKLSERTADRPVIVAAGTQVRIPDDRLRVVTFPDNTFSILIIRNVLPEDAAKYKCSLPIITGTRTSFTSLKVLEVKSDHIATSPKETSLSSGEELNLFCQPDDSKLNVWWTAKDSKGNNIDVTRGFDRVAGKRLTIMNIQRNQAGIYSCHVAMGHGSPIRRHFKVVVKERPWPIEAYISGFKVNSLLANYNKQPVYGDNVNLRCETGGVPIPTVLWFKDGRKLADSHKYTISAYEPTYKEHSVISKLTIQSFQRFDEGRYLCKGVNDAGSQEQQFDIRGIVKDDSKTANSDDEDIAKTAALKGRRGELKISICKAGMPCRSAHPYRSRVGAGVDKEYSGDDTY